MSNDKKLEAFRQVLATMPLEQVLCHEAVLWEERVLNFELLKACDERRQALERFAPENIAKTYENSIESE